MLLSVRAAGNHVADEGEDNVCPSAVNVVLRSPAVEGGVGAKEPGVHILFLFKNKAEHLPRAFQGVSFGAHAVCVDGTMEFTVHDLDNSIGRSQSFFVWAEKIRMVVPMKRTLGV